MRATSILLLLIPVFFLGCGSSGGEDPAAPGSATVTVQGLSELAVGASAQFLATTDGGTDSGYTWTSSDGSVLMVDGAGVVTGIGKGSATISAVGLTSGASGAYLVEVNFDPSNDVPWYDDWKGSAHADETAEAFRHWDDTGVIPASCAKCHSRHGFRDFVGEDGSMAGQVDTDHPTGSVVDCVTCHNDSTLQLSDVTFPSGVTVSVDGREAVCMTCHQGRESTDSVNAAILAADPDDDDEILPDQGFINVHYFPAAATRYGGQVRGGYLYDGQSYDVRFRHVEGAHDCQECHNQHTLEIRFDRCQECHVGATDLDDLHEIRMKSSLTRDYDGDGNRTEGLWDEIQGMRAILYAAIQKYSAEVLGKPIMYDASAYPYWFNDNGNGANFGNRYKTFTARTLKATFNFQYATKDPGGFAHNGKFIIQIMHDSIQDLNAGLDENDKDMLEFKGVRNDVGHFDGTAEAFRHWDEDGEVDAGCAKCHGGSEGFSEYLTYGANTSQEIANGFDCAVCHENFGSTFDIRIVRTVTFPSGYTTPQSSTDQNDPAVQSNICMTCHQGRVSKVQIDAAIEANNLRFQNIHYLAAGATLMGNLAKGGYEYEGLEYAGRWPHSEMSTNNNCTNCHSATGTQHTFHPEDNIGYCQQCHKKGNIPGNPPIDSFEEIRIGSNLDYNRNGSTTEPLKDELQSIAQQLLEQMQQYCKDNELDDICYDGHGYPYFFKDTNGNGDRDPGENSSFRDWDAALIKAAHNYQHSQKEPGAWVHNFAYITQLVIDSYRDLGGDEDDHIRPPTDE
jgi:hypothetical protein